MAWQVLLLYAHASAGEALLYKGALPEPPSTATTAPAAATTAPATATLAATAVATAATADTQTAVRIQVPGRDVCLCHDHEEEKFRIVAHRNWLKTAHSRLEATHPALIYSCLPSPTPNHVFPQH